MESVLDLSVTNASHENMFLCNEIAHGTGKHLVLSNYLVWFIKKNDWKYHKLRSDTWFQAMDECKISYFLITIFFATYYFSIILCFYFYIIF